MKKKLFSILLITCLLLTVFAGCKKKSEEPSESKDKKPTQAVVDDKNQGNAGNNEQNNQGDNKQGDNTSGNQTTDPETQAVKAEYFSEKMDSFLNNYVATVNDVSANVAQNGMDIELSTSLPGELISSVASLFVSQSLAEKIPAELALKLFLGLDTNGNNGTLQGKLSLNKESIDINGMLKDNTLFVAIPELFTKSLQLDISEIAEDLTSDMDEVKIDQKKVTEAYSQFISDLKASFIQVESKDNETFTMKCDALSNALTVTGTKSVEKWDGAKLKEAFENLKNNLVAAGFPESLVSIDFSDDDLDQATITYYTDKKSYAIELKSAKGDSNGAVFINDKYILFGSLEKDATEYNVPIYVERTGEKSGNIIIMDDGEKVDDFTFSYQIKDKGFALSGKIAASGMDVQFSVDFSEKVVSANVVLASAGTKLFDINVKVTMRDYADRSMQFENCTSDPTELGASISIDKLDSIVKGLLGTDLVTLVQELQGAEY